MAFRKAVVFCSAAGGLDPKYDKAAREVVRALHAYGWGLVSGGSFRGLMGSLSDEMERLGGEHTGVIPRFMKGLEYPSYRRNSSGPIRCRDGRNGCGREPPPPSPCPAVIGSLDEFVETHVLRKLGRYDGNLLVLNLDGFYDPWKDLLRHYESHGMLEARDRDLVIFVDTVEELASHLK